jgi:hypothetical protein
MPTTICLMFTLLAMAGTAPAAVRLTEETANGHTVYRLENGRVNLVISPHRGGAVTSYRDKLGDNVELVPQILRTGLGLDHFQAQRWPGELLEVPYLSRVVTQTAAACVVEVRRQVTGAWENIPHEKLRDVQLVKTYTLRADSPALRCDVILTAPPHASPVVDYWQQAVAYPGGQYEPARASRTAPSPNAPPARRIS